MKKLILASVLLTSLVTTTAFAQPKKGSWMVGADIAGAAASNPGGGNMLFHAALTPKAGYFLTNRLVAGTSLNMGLAVGKKQYALAYGISPFLRYYFAKKDGVQLKKINFFSEVSAGYLGNSYVDKVNDMKFQNNNFSASAGIGAAYFITPNVSLEASYNLNYYSPFKVNSNINQLQQGLKVGFQIYFNRKNKDNAGIAD